MAAVARNLAAFLLVFTGNLSLAFALPCDDLQAEIARLRRTLAGEQSLLATCVNHAGTCTSGQMIGIQNAIDLANEEIAFDQSQVLFTCSGPATLSGWRLTEVQPDIAYGGRANTIAVHPTNDKIILVASESGGMFRSIDRGRTWHHIDRLPDYLMGSVAFLSANPNIVVATTTDAFTSSDGGGIWRSTDAGENWSHVTNPAPPAGSGARFSAYEISIGADTGTVFVGTSYGVSISADRGVTWKSVDVYQFGPDRSVFAVLALVGDRILAGGVSGIRRSTDAGASWIIPSSNVGNVRGQDLHAFGASPFAAGEAFLVNDSAQLFRTADAGDHWDLIPTAPPTEGSCGGNAFIKAIGHSFSSGIRLFRFTELYFGNRCWLFTLNAFGSDYGGRWQGPVPLDHKDTRDLAFDNSGSPLLIATDGGLHQTTDGGLHWSFIGGGISGYNALQLTEVDGQWTKDSQEYDLYLGTQDNMLWSSPDLGKHWTMGPRSEGFYIEMLHQVATAADSQITLVAIEDCNTNCSSGPLFSHLTTWNNPPGTLSNPLIVRKSFHVQNIVSSDSLSHGLAVSMDLGKSWQQYASFSEDWAGRPKLSDPVLRVIPRDPPVLYQVIRAGFDPSRGINVGQLVRVVKNRVGTDAAVSFPLMNNFGGFGINPTMFAWYVVFGLDPGDTKHIIAPDIVAQKMMETRDGGNNWIEIPGLTSLVTNGDKLLFTSHAVAANVPVPQVSVVSFSREDAHMVAVGTWQSGIFVSADNGVKWNKVPGSQRMTRITSIEWRTPTDAFISTYGRGLWRLKFEVSNPGPGVGPGVGPLPCANCSVVVPSGQRTRATSKNAVYVYNGRVEGARAHAGVLNEIFVSPGSWARFISDSPRSSSVRVTETPKWMGFPDSLKQVTRSSGQGLAVVGLLLGHNKSVSGLVLAKETLETPPLALDHPFKSRTRAEEIVGSNSSPTASRPYLHLVDGRDVVPPGQTIALAGRNFEPGSKLAIYIDDYAAEDLLVSADGTFSVEVTAPRQFGSHRLTVRAISTGQTIDGANLMVAPFEEP